MPVTAESILDTYAADIAAIVDEKPVTDLGPFALQVYRAGEELQANRIAGYQQLDMAAAYLFDVVNAAPEPRPVCLRTAAHYLAEAADMIRDFLATR